MLISTLVTIEKCRVPTGSGEPVKLRIICNLCNFLKAEGQKGGSVKACSHQGLLRCTLSNAHETCCFCAGRLLPVVFLRCPISAVHRKTHWPLQQTQHNTSTQEAWVWKDLTFSTTQNCKRLSDCYSWLLENSSCEVITMGRVGLWLCDHKAVICSTCPVIQLGRKTTTHRCCFWRDDCAKDSNLTADVLARTQRTFGCTVRVWTRRLFLWRRRKANCTVCGRRCAVYSCERFSKFVCTILWLSQRNTFSRVFPEFSGNSDRQPSPSKKCRFDAFWRLSFHYD